MFLKDLRSRDAFNVLEEGRVSTLQAVFYFFNFLTVKNEGLF